MTATFSYQWEIGFIEGRTPTQSSSTTTTAPVAYAYPWAAPRTAGLSFTAGDKVTVIVPTPATLAGGFSLKSYVDFDGWTGFFDGDGANKLDTGTALFDFTVLAPHNTPSFSSTTSTTT